MKYIIELWKRTFDYKGRSGKKEFWIPFAIHAALAIIFVILIFLKMIINPLAIPIIILGIYLAAGILPFISLTVRRLHDTGRSGGWYWLIFALGVGAVILIIMLAGRTYSFDPTTNFGVCVYGPPPDDYYNSEEAETDAVETDAVEAETDVADTNVDETDVVGTDVAETETDAVEAETDVADTNVDETDVVGTDVAE
ncbi:MAG: DUF805 domain-containing protein, partial [Oscillospiraceae bacterium]|nr:DUF805 domain-containing protein [Oscillospiraceae bacterium]